MTKCSDFYRDKKVPWIDDILDVCMYSEDACKCKLRDINNKTALVHDYHYSNNRVSMVLR